MRQHLRNETKCNEANEVKRNERSGVGEANGT